MTRCFQKLLLALSVALMLPLAAHANLTTLNALFVFGDSLSDGGNYDGPGGRGAYPPDPYAGARYSNGPTAVEYLWQAYHPGDKTFKPSNFGGTNYALGGATSGTVSYAAIFPGETDDAVRAWFATQGGVSNQVKAFSDGCDKCFVADESLFVVWAFPNDVFSNALLGAAALSPAELINSGVTNIVEAVLKLGSEGASNFLVPNMPDLGKTPAFSGDSKASAEMLRLTVAFNTALAGALTALDQTMNGVSITQFDTFGTLNALVGNPEQYGFRNVTDQCVMHLVDRTCDPDTWLFWDDLHPTTATHAILGAQFAAAIPEPDSLWLLALALLLLAMRRWKTGAIRFRLLKI